MTEAKIRAFEKIIDERMAAAKANIATQSSIDTRRKEKIEQKAMVAVQSVENFTLADDEEHLSKIRQLYKENVCNNWHPRRRLRFSIDQVAILL